MLITVVFGAVITCVKVCCAAFTSSNTVRLCLCVSGLVLESPPVAEFARSPGLRKKLLPSQVRKTEQRRAASPLLVLPKPLSFRAAKPGAAGQPSLGVSSAQSQDDFYVNPGRGDASGKQERSFSHSATTTSALFRQLKTINKLGQTYAAHSPLETSPCDSPLDSPRLTPRASPSLQRRTQSPLTLDADRQPEFV